MTTKKTWQVENVWTCSSCGTTNRGRDIVCSSCNDPKENNEEEQLPEDITPEAAVTDPELRQLAAAAPHWECGFCGGQERSSQNTCAKCGASAQMNRESSRDHPRQAGPMPVPVEQTVMATKLGISGLLAMAGAVAAVASVVVGTVIWLFLPHHKQAQVESVSWSRTAQLSVRSTRQDAGWQNQVPGDAFNESCETRQNGTKSCNPHDCHPHQTTVRCNPHDCRCSTSCAKNGNGFSNCTKSCSTCYDQCAGGTVYDTCYDQCPNFDQWCDYSHYVWTAKQMLETSGHDHNPVWPDLQASGPDQRLERTETYDVSFGHDGQHWAYSPATEAEFKKYNPGDTWDIKVNHAGQVWVP